MGMTHGRTGVCVTLFSWKARRIIGYGHWKNRRVPNCMLMAGPGRELAYRLGNRRIPYCMLLEEPVSTWLRRLGEPAYT